MRIVNVDDLKQALIEDTEIDGRTFDRVRLHIEALAVEVADEGREKHEGTNA